jgi:hypothetical protein
MVEYLDIAIMRIKSRKNRLALFLSPMVPIFHYSIIPIFQVGRNPWFRRGGK